MAFRKSNHPTMASQTNDHASPFSMSRMFTREHVVQNAVAKTGNLDSSQLTHLKSAPKTLDRTNYSPSTPMDVKRAVHRVRSSGSVAPKKKNAVVAVAFTITYDRNGALSGGPTDNYGYGRGGRVVVLGPGNLVYPANAAFLAWNTSPSGTGTVLLPGNTLVISQNTILYAISQPLWPVLYDSNSPTATGAQQDPNLYAAGSQAVLLDQGTMLNPGLTFMGWNALLSPGTIITVPYGGITMNAFWANVIPILWQINYELNSDTATGEQNGPQYLAGATATVLNQGTMENPGFSFLGWSTDELATVPDYPVGFTFVMPVGDVTLYAIWEQIGPIETWYLNASHNVGLNFSGLENITIPSAGQTFETVAETGGLDVIVQTNSLGQFLSSIFNRNDEYIVFPKINGIYASEMWTWRQYATVSNSSGTVTLSFKFYIFHGDDNTQTYIGQSPQSAAITTTPGSYVDFSYTFPDLTLTLNDRFMVELYQNGTGTSASLFTNFEGTLYSAISVLL